MISFKDFSNLCKKYNFYTVPSTAGVDFIGFEIENKKNFFTIGMYRRDAYFCWIYDGIVLNYYTNEFHRTKCNTIEEFEKGLQNAVLLKKQLLIKIKIDEIEKGF